MEQFTDSQSFFSTTLTQSITATQTDIPVSNVPSVTTCFLVVEKGTPNEEIMLLISVDADILTVIRGLNPVGGSPEDDGFGVSHPAGASVELTNVHYYLKEIQNKPTFSYRGAYDGTDAINAIANPLLGDVAIDSSTGFTYYFNGTIWVVTSGGSAPADASSSVKGIVKLSVAPDTSTNPIAVGDNDPRVPSTDTVNALAGDGGSPSSGNTYVTQHGLQFGAEVYAASSTGTDAYAITPNPALITYGAGVHFFFQADVDNAGAASLNISGLGAITIKRPDGTDLQTGDIVAGEVCEVVHNGTNLQLMGTSKGGDLQVFTSSGTWTKPAGLSGNEMVIVQLWAGGGGGGSGASPFGGGGGGGGAYVKATMRASDLGSTVSVTIGTGGAAGSPGVNSSFGSVFPACAGGAGGNDSGSAPGGGGGGGALGIGQDASGATSGAGGEPGGSASGVSNSGSGGGGGHSGNSAEGGGGGASGNSGDATLSGGNSVYGGGGGGGGSGTSGSGGGASAFGGDGGGGGTGGSAGTAGTAPAGGGGGGGSTGAGGAGARGECRVFVMR